METTVKTVVTLKSSTFNMSEPREYFINPGCFGDDLAKWLAEQLRSKRYQASEVPGQEDFGWYFTFVESGVEHCFVIGLRPGDDDAEDLWIGGSNGAEASLHLCWEVASGISNRMQRGLSIKFCRAHRKFRRSAGTFGATLIAVARKSELLPPPRTSNRVFQHPASTTVL
jgi:hypothetical protein